MYMEWEEETPHEVGQKQNILTAKIWGLNFNSEYMTLDKLTTLTCGFFIYTNRIIILTSSWDSCMNETG